MTETAPVANRPWHKATATNDRGACVEVTEGTVTGIRDTKNRDKGALWFNADEWQAFVEGVKRGEL
ncbi:DUF397 domain-containing protein [Marinactinospora thermotolerans]|uniref:DUF397 domain-containing protein n=1 Tax=Marinactinospora thermotolerans TaxID=531310 RepID=UPI003D933BE2